MMVLIGFSVAVYALMVVFLRRYNTMKEAEDRTFRSYVRDCKLGGTTFPDVDEYLAQHDDEARKLLFLEATRRPDWDSELRLELSSVLFPWRSALWFAILIPVNIVNLPLTWNLMIDGKLPPELASVLLLATAPFVATVAVDIADRLWRRVPRRASEFR
ncbi:hypothetical protein [Glycomyces arizonensis]|uniref:hypothetical protein n=1 Tax=Glycomyces arizonensis TaxID=256035 RepID=UPI0012EC9414|nr:hypothetical protein [Glycomyces arizonensis]